MKDLDKKHNEENSTQATNNDTSDGYLPLTLVTGATGYIAGHVIKILLENGYRVRATYRDAVKNEAKLEALKQWAFALGPHKSGPRNSEENGTSAGVEGSVAEGGAVGQLEFFEADLNNPEQWIEPVKGCTYVIHIAGPPFSTSNGQANEEDIIQSDQEIIDTAVQGTLNVLKACKASQTVKRVVLTSSFSTIIGDPALVDSGKEYTEADWTDCGPEACPVLEIYPKAKTLAEKAAWDFVNPPTIVADDKADDKVEAGVDAQRIENGGVEDRPTPPTASPEKEEKDIVDEVPNGSEVIPEDDYSFELVVMNPVVVLGPQINDKTTGSGIELIKKLMKRDIPALPKINFLIVDVRDVALAHYRGMTIPEAAGKRFILCNRGIWMKEIANVLSKEFKSKGYPVPTLHCPYIAVWVKSFFDKNLKRYLPSIGKEISCSNQNMRSILGITPRELHQTILDMAQSLIESGKITKEQLKTSSIFSNKKDKSSHSVKGINAGDKTDSDDNILENGVEEHDGKQASPNDPEAEPLITEKSVAPLENATDIKVIGGEIEKIKLLPRTSGSDPEINKTQEHGVDTLPPLATATAGGKRPGQKFGLHHSLSMNKVKLFKNGWPSFLHKRQNLANSTEIEEEKEPTAAIVTNGEGTNEGDQGCDKKVSDSGKDDKASGEKKGDQEIEGEDKQGTLGSATSSTTDTPSKRGSKKKWSLHHGTGGLSSSVAGKCFPNYFKSLVSDDKCGNKACSKDDASTNSSKSNTLDASATHNQTVPLMEGENRLNSPKNATLPAGAEGVTTQRDNSITYIDSLPLAPNNNINNIITNLASNENVTKIQSPLLGNIGTCILNNIKIGGSDNSGNVKSPPVVLISSRSITPESELLVPASNMTASYNNGTLNTSSPDVKLITAEAGYITSPNSHCGQLYIISPGDGPNDKSVEKACNGQEEFSTKDKDTMSSSKFYVATTSSDAKNSSDGACKNSNSSPAKASGHSRKDSLTNSSAFLSSIQGVSLCTNPSITLTNGFGDTSDHHTNGHCNGNGVEEEDGIEDEICPSSVSISATKNLDASQTTANKNNTTLRVMA